MSRYEVVKDYYDQNPNREWVRLEETKLEFILTTKYLDQYINNKSVIFDVGGGPGRYSIYLAKKGHDLYLLDLSKGNIDLAIEKSKEEKTSLKEAIVGNAIDLTRYSDNYFDVVLNLGPMYHILDEEDRKKAIKESLRVLKSGGLIVFSFISKYSAVYYNLNFDPKSILSMKNIFMRFIQNSQHLLSDEEPVFTDAYYVEPNDLEAYMNQFAITKKAIIGAEGMVS